MAFFCVFIDDGDGKDYECVGQLAVILCRVQMTYGAGRGGRGGEIYYTR